MSAKAIQGYLVGLEGLNDHIYKIYLPDKQKVVRVRDVRFHESAKQDHKTDSEVEFEAILVDPDIENRGRIIYNNITTQET